jgi:Domain of unknown function (DUF1707)
VTTPSLRASDADRERTASLLREHCAAGRLTVEDLERRVTSAYAAQTVGELQALTEDLPGLSRRDVARPRRSRRRFFLPGVTSFHEVRQLSVSPEDAYEDAMRTIVPRMALHGFHLRDEAPPRRLGFLRGDGLRVTVLLLGDEGGTELSAFGEAPRAIRRAFARLSE